MSLDVLSQTFKTVVNEANTDKPQRVERRRYLSLLIGLLGLVTIISNVVSFFVGPFASQTIPILLPAGAIALIAAALMRSRYALVGEALAIVTVFAATTSVAFLGLYPTQLLLMAFPIFVISFYLRPLWTIAATIAAVVLTLAGTTLHSADRLHEAVLVLGLVTGVGVTMTLITYMLRQSQRSLTVQNERLRASEARFRGVLDAGADALFLVEPIYDDAGNLVDATVIDVNQQAAGMLNRPHEAIVGQRLLTIDPQLADHPLIQRARQMPSDARDFSFEYTSSLGNIYTMRLHRMENLLAATLRDITEARRNEQIQREMQQLTIQLEKERELNGLRATLMSTISHEFRTPLTIIMNNAEILDRYSQRLTDTQREERILGIKEQVVQLRTMLENISLIIRGTSNRLPFNPEEADLGLYMRMLFEQVTEPAKETHSLTFEAIGNLKHTVVDLTLLHQVVSNLLTNSLKFTPLGGRVYLQLDGQAPDQILIVVSDTGIGIPEEDLTHIFEPFHRGSNIGEVRGTGLGLSIVRECVLRHGGTLQVESTVGVGSTFTVHLPRCSLPPLTD